MSASKLETATEKPASVRFGLMYFDVNTALKDIAALRKGYTQTGNWSLPQIAWHLTGVMVPYSKPAAHDASSTDAQDAKIQSFMKTILEPGGSGKFPASPELTPAADCKDADVDRLVAAFELLRDFPTDKVDLGPFGAQPIDLVRRLHLIHAAHHLAFLAPNGLRESLTYADEDAAIADVMELRRGCRKLGEWTLPQACWHLNTTIRARLKPGPFEPDTAEQRAMRPVILNAIRVRRLPIGVTASPMLVPPVEANDDAIDEFLDALKLMKNRKEPISPHRIFGTMTVEEARAVNLMHCAHHLKRFVSTA